MNKINKRECKSNKKTVLKYREGNVVDFNIENIIKVAEVYKLEVKQINDITVQIVNNKTKSYWFAVNRKNFIELRHKNQGSDNIHSHHQRDFYDIEFMLKSIATHDMFKINCSDYRNSGIGKMFEMIQNGKSKYIKIC